MNDKKKGHEDDKKTKKLIKTFTEGASAQRYEFRYFNLISIYFINQ